MDSLAYIGIYGNEEADSVAKSTTLGPSSEPINIPFTDYFEQYKKTAREERNTYIENQSSFKETHYFKHL